MFDQDTQELRELTPVELEAVSGGWSKCPPPPCGCKGGGIKIGIDVDVGLVVKL
jgi:hypothetical protein